MHSRTAPLPLDDYEQFGPQFGPQFGAPSDGLFLPGPSGSSLPADSAVVILTAAARLAGALVPGSVPAAALACLDRTGRVGVYTASQRKARIDKFHERRKARIWRKRIKYDCRKKLADGRPRIRGRFVKRGPKRGDGDGEGEEMEGEEMAGDFAGDFAAALFNQQSLF